MPSSARSGERALQRICKANRPAGNMPYRDRICMKMHIFSIGCACLAGMQVYMKIGTKFGSGGGT